MRAEVEPLVKELELLDRATVSAWAKGGSRAALEYYAQYFETFSQGHYSREAARAVDELVVRYGRERAQAAFDNADIPPSLGALEEGVLIERLAPAMSREQLLEREENAFEQELRRLGLKSFPSIKELKARLRLTRGCPTYDELLPDADRRFTESVFWGSRRRVLYTNESLFGYIKDRSMEATSLSEVAYVVCPSTAYRTVGRCGPYSLEDGRSVYQDRVAKIETIVIREFLSGRVVKRLTERSTPPACPPSTTVKVDQLTRVIVSNPDIMTPVDTKRLRDRVRAFYAEIQ